MASSKDYLEYILDQLSGLDDIDSVSDDQRTADTISKLKSRYIPACRHVPDNGQAAKQVDMFLTNRQNVDMFLTAKLRTGSSRWTCFPVPTRGLCNCSAGWSVTPSRSLPALKVRGGAV